MIALGASRPLRTFAMHKIELMSTFVILLRGINVGGKNNVAMAALIECLEELGFSHVSTYIASGNVILVSDKSADEIRAQIEEALPQSFRTKQ